MLLLESTRLFLQLDSPRAGIHLFTLPFGRLAMALRLVRPCAMVWNGHRAIAGALVAVAPGAAIPKGSLGRALHDHHQWHRLSYACIRAYVWHYLVKGRSIYPRL